MNMTLIFQGTEVGTLKDVFLDDGVWHGRFEDSLGRNSPVQSRIAEFIEFCRTWNEECRVGEADAGAFAVFADVVVDGDWLARSDDLSRSLRIENAPAFFVGGDVSFREKK